MAGIFWIDRENGISYEVWDELVEPAEYILHLSRMVADKDWPPKHRMHVVDLRSVPMQSTPSEASTRKVAAYAVKGFESFRDFKVAVLVNEAISISADFSRLMTQFPVIIIVFTRPELACIWLGVDYTETASKLGHLKSQMCAAAVGPEMQTMETGIECGIDAKLARKEELRIELKEILFKVKHPDTTHEEFFHLMERLGKAWEEFIQELDKNKVQ